jgi:hypothetical protein
MNLSSLTAMTHNNKCSAAMPREKEMRKFKQP